MGLIAEVLKGSSGSCSNGGISEQAEQVCIVNVEGPFGPREEAPAVLLLAGNVANTAKLVPAELETGMQAYGGNRWKPVRGGVGPMMGGCFAYTPDGRFSEAVAKLTGVAHSGPVPLHDRFETPAQYASHD